MELQVLMENTARAPEFVAEHGLSLYIETQGHRLLFDTGASGGFAENARLLGVDLSRVEALIVSHGHYDHGGGIRAFLACNCHAPVYLSRHAFGAHYNASGKYIGLDQDLLDHPRLVFVDGPGELFPGIRLETCTGAVSAYPPAPGGLQILTGEGFRPDPFAHELYLTVREGERKLCFSGCAHRGVENILTWLEPQVLIGGFHFKGLEPDAPRLAHAARILARQECTYYTCHCTGRPQFDWLKQTLGARLQALTTGDIINI